MYERVHGVLGARAAVARGRALASLRRRTVPRPQRPCRQTDRRRALRAISMRRACNRCGCGPSQASSIARHAPINPTDRSIKKPTEATAGQREAKKRPGGEKEAARKARLTTYAPLVLTAARRIAYRVFRKGFATKDRVTPRSPSDPRLEPASVKPPKSVYAHARSWQRP